MDDEERGHQPTGPNEGSDTEDGRSRQDDSNSKRRSKKRARGEALEEQSSGAALGARLFYFITYGLFYLSLLWYANPMRDILFFTNGFSLGDWIYVAFYATLHGLAIHYFLTAGAKPGFVNQTETEHDRKALEMMQIQHQPSGEAQSEDDEESIGFPIDRSTSSMTNRKDKAFLGKKPASYAQVDSLELSTDVESSKNNLNAVAEESKDASKLVSITIKEADESGKVGSIEHIHVEKVQMPPKRFCEACQIVQPYRSRHCWECNHCVRKFDHHCFWIGGCVGELNHGKFWLFLFWQTFSEILSLSLAMSAHAQATINYPDSDDALQRRQRQHIYTIFMIFVVLLFLFVIFTSILCGYHTYLIVSGQTTWEHASRSNITYMKVYPVGIMPFYTSFTENIKQVFFHNGKVQDWQLGQPAELRKTQGFNICDNEYYTCC